MILELTIIILSINLVKFREHNVSMVIEAGTCSVGKLHEAIQARSIAKIDVSEKYMVEQSGTRSWSSCE
jgi:hypothetical protein